MKGVICGFAVGCLGTINLLSFTKGAGVVILCMIGGGLLEEAWHRL